VDEELLRQLNLQLRDLMESMKIMGGNSDRVVSAIAKLAVQMEKRITSQAREQDAIEKFVKGVDKATASIQENRQAQQQLQDEADAAAAELEKLADTAKGTSEELEKQTRIREASEKIRKARQEQWREKEITTAGQLISEYEKGAGATQMLRDRLETVGGTSLVMNTSARLAVAGLQGLGKALVQYTKAIYDGEQGALVAAKAVTTFANEVSTAAMTVGAALMFIPGLGIASRIAGAAITSLGAAAKFGAKATELAAEQSDRLYGSFVELTKSGVTSSDGMLGLADSAQRLGYGLDQVGIQAFNALMQSASRDLSMLAGSAADGRRSFSRFSGEIVRSDVGRQLMMMGLSVDDINTGVAGFIKQQVSLGRAQILTQRQLREESAAYVRELDAVAKLTGIQKQELESQMDANRRNERFRAAIERVRMEQGDEAARNLELNMAVASERFPGLSEGLKDIAAGFINTEAAAQVFRAGMGNIPKLMTRGLGTGFQEMGQAAQRTTRAMGSLAAVGAYGPVFGNFYESLKAAGMSEQDAAKRALEIVKEQEKGGDAAVAAQVDLRRSQMELRDDLQDLILQGVTPSTEALSGFAGVVNRASRTLQETLGIKPTEGYDGEVDPTLAEKIGGYAGTAAGAAAGVKMGAVVGSLLGPVGTIIGGAAGGIAGGVLGHAGGTGLAGVLKPSAAAPESRAPTPGAPAAPRPGFEQSNETLRRLGLQIKQGDVQQEGKTVSPKILDMAQKIQASVPGFRYFSGFNDRYHNEQAPSSFHTRGQALDFTLSHRPTQEEGRKILQMLKSMGADYARDEYNFPSSKATAGHFHAHVREFARGGIASGPESGYPATLHGNEAVVPLPDGRTIPVDFDTQNLTTSITSKVIPLIDQSLANIRMPAANFSMENIRPDIENTLQQSQTEMLTTLERYLQRSTDTPAPRTDTALLTAMQELIDLQRKNNTVSERLLQASTS
jgi:hypothetical protein